MGRSAGSVFGPLHLRSGNEPSSFPEGMRLMGWHYFKGAGGFFRIGQQGPGISWTNRGPLFSERHGYRKAFLRAFGWRFFWLKPYK